MSFIRKYMSFTKFYSLISTKKLYFHNCRSFDDRLDSALASESVLSFARAFSNVDGFGVLQQGMTPVSADEFCKMNKNHEEECEKVFVSSWTLDDIESVALWKIFIGNTDGICLVSSTEKLESSLKITSNENLNLEFGRVEYSNNTINLKPFFQKDKCYEYEKEYRVCAKLSQASKKVGYEIEVELSKLIEEIVIGPFSNIISKEMIEDMLKTFGLNIPVYYSSVSEGVKRSFYVSS